MTPATPADCGAETVPPAEPQASHALQEKFCKQHDLTTYLPIPASGASDRAGSVMHFRRHLATAMKIPRYPDPMLGLYRQQ